jgi:hypothetical protein
MALYLHSPIRLHGVVLSYIPGLYLTFKSGTRKGLFGVFQYIQHSYTYGWTCVRCTKSSHYKCEE